MQTTLIKKQVQTSDIFEAAIEIGNYLVNTAVWSTDKAQCNWLGRRDILEADLRAYATRTAAMSPELYSGSSGIALFLAELYGLTGKEAFAQTAWAAWHRSVSYLYKKDFPASPISVYAGDLGLLYVATRFEKLQMRPKRFFNKHKKYLINKIIHGLNINHGLDRIGGNAGAIGILFRLAQELSIERLHNVAIQCADELVQQASWKEDMCFWEAKKVHGVEIENPPMTGFSHGAAGIGLSLLEAFSYTSEQTYLEHGRGAFQFEKALFNDEENNWIDTRYPHAKKEGKIVGTFRAAWCHGAPGEALAHTKAAALDTGMMDFYLDMAERAIHTTQTSLAGNLLHPEKDATLCHGSFGLSDILLTCGLLLSKPDLVDTAQAAANTLLAKMQSPLIFPSGLHAGGYSPSLMTGLAGVGYHFTRLHAPQQVPSVLLID